MQQYLNLYGALRATFQKENVVRIPRSQDCNADSLTTLASSLDACVP